MSPSPSGPSVGFPTDNVVPARWWTRIEDGRIECRLCSRHCRLNEGQRGFCFVRRRDGDRLVLTAFGQGSGFWGDPIEKKPLHHFLPGTGALSFGTQGCNLGCRFCQNWDLTKARELDRLAERVTPHDLVYAARYARCRSVAFTYNDPVIFAEWALAVAATCRRAHIHTVAVTAGYISAEARPDFFAGMDATNIDLKSFSEDFYRRMCLGHLQPVLDTLAYVHRETDVWLEVTTLLIPGANDSDAELDRASDWFAATLGPDVPWHFTAFHPDFKLTDRPPTPPETLHRARAMARAKGLHYVYTGNIEDPEGSTTWCPKCGLDLVGRQNYRIGTWALRNGCCAACGLRIPGRFETLPGLWGSRRLPIRLGGFGAG